MTTPAPICMIDVRRNPAVIGARILKLLDEVRGSWTDVCEKLGINHETLRRWREHIGRTVPSFDESVGKVLGRHVATIQARRADNGKLGGRPVIKRRALRRASP